MEKKIQKYKIDRVRRVNETIEANGDVFFTEYRGLKVSQMTQLRRTLAKSGGTYRVVKNAMARIAFRNKGIEDKVGSMLIGPTAIVYVNGESGAAAKALIVFAKENPALVVKGGLVLGEVYDAKQLVAYSALPTKIDLVAMFARVLNEPMAQFARALQAVADQKTA
jgi:large subunit ribosomal protein L10